MRVARTESFKRAYRKLSRENRDRASKDIRQLVEDPRHPGLRVRRIEGTRNVWEARVSRSWRLTFKAQGDTYLLRNIGEHNKVLKKP